MAAAPPAPTAQPRVRHVQVGSIIILGDSVRSSKAKHRNTSVAVKVDFSVAGPFVVLLYCAHDHVFFVV